MLRVRARFHALPAYLVIVIVRHIVVPAALLIETDYSPPVGLQLAIYLPLTVLMSLALLQPVKGAVVGLQWALRMHGFDDNAPEGILPASAHQLDESSQYHGGYNGYV